MKHNQITKLFIGGLLCCTALQAAEMNQSSNNNTSASAPMKKKCTLNTGVSLGAFGGANWAHTPVPMGSVEFDAGYFFGGSLGYRWHWGLELEGELGFRRNHFDEFKFNRIKFDASGHLRKWTYMGNIKYYLPVHWYITPNVGLGAGYASQKIFFKSINGVSIGSHKKKEGYAWQVLAGLTCYLCKHLDLDIDYHYTVLKGSTHDNSVSAGLTGSF